MEALHKEKVSKDSMGPSDSYTTNEGEVTVGDNVFHPVVSPNLSHGSNGGSSYQMHSLFHKLLPKLMLEHY